MGETTDKQKVVVVGAGPVGALAALYAAGRGDHVEVYELRSDLRDPSTTPLNFTKSINLALSERGVNSLRQSGCNGLLDDVLAQTTPMSGRMIHARRKDGKLYEESQEYDIHGRCIRAVDRAALNKRLLDALEQLPNVTLYFNHKLTGANFNNQTAWFERHQTTNLWSPSERAKEISVNFDLLIGADGAHSAARYHLMKYARVDYHQEYIDTLWCEFRIQPTMMDSKTDFAISPNHLHIWPGGSFMFIAIPSLDKSFTCTLFAPSEHFADIVKDPNQTLLPFFQNNFPGVCPELISPSDLQSQFITNPHLPLISIKCNPHHYGSSVVILGDAAHAMVPFYGQGMNAGLEDVRVLFDYLDGYGVYDPTCPDPESRTEVRKEALQAYTSQRTPDAFAINNLGLRNYEEMRSGVTSPLYRLRKWVEEKVSVCLPILGWETQYSRVSFENGRYSEVEKAVGRQGRILVGTLGIVVFGVMSISGHWLWKWNHGQPAPRW